MNFVNEEQNYFAPFKKHECILNNKSESFENKIESLIDVWKSVGELNLSQFDIRHVIQIMDWAKLHALNIVLTAEWNGFKATHQAKLLQEIQKAQNELLKLNSAFATRCKKLADVVKNPWEDPILMTLMKTKDAEIGTEEIEFFCVETAYLVSVRLKKLCESQCEDLALNLVTAFMNCNKLSKSQNFSLNATETQMWFIFDTYIALLYKFQERQKIVILLKELSFIEGLQLVKRFAKKRVKISKIWKNCHRVAILATQMYISQAVVKYTEELKEILESYIELYMSLCTSESLIQDFSTSIRRISNLADAAGLYIFCDVLQRKAGSNLKPFVIEMYIRALTTDMNELERQKDANETEKVEIITSRLAIAFINLAEFLDEHVKVARECVLTSFSLAPTKERLTKIEDLARRSGFQVLDTGQEWKCKLHPPVLPSDDITWICPECGDWMCKPQLNVPIKINMALNEALQNSVLGISEALCDDLVVCLSNPRYQILSWFLPWDDLHRLCIMYLQDPQTTKNFVTELKFVDIDYSIFKGIKREPLDELAGIERGYEQYLDQDFVSGEDSSSNSEDSMSQDSRPYSLGSDGAGEGPFFPLLPQQPKSDPNTLKSLRMFRPSLKRSKEKETGESTPEKQFKGNSIDGNKDLINQPKPTSLSNFLNSVPPTVSAAKSSVFNEATLENALNNSTQDPESKNVKTATLPLLGGQVAKEEIKSIQVYPPALKDSRCSKENVFQESKSLSSVNNKELIKKNLMSKLLNKQFPIGVKEKSSQNETPHSCQQFREAKIFIKTPLKINKESNSLPIPTPISFNTNPKNLQIGYCPPNNQQLQTDENLNTESMQNKVHQELDQFLNLQTATKNGKDQHSLAQLLPDQLQKRVLSLVKHSLLPVQNTSLKNNKEKVQPNQLSNQKQLQIQLIQHLEHIQQLKQLQSNSCNSHKVPKHCHSSEKSQVSTLTQVLRNNSLSPDVVISNPNRSVVTSAIEQVTLPVTQNLDIVPQVNFNLDKTHLVVNQNKSCTPIITSPELAMKVTKEEVLNQAQLDTLKVADQDKNHLCIQTSYKAITLNQLQIPLVPVEAVTKNPGKVSTQLDIPLPPDQDITLTNSGQMPVASLSKLSQNLPNQGKISLDSPKLDIIPTVQKSPASHSPANMESVILTNQDKHQHLCCHPLKPEQSRKSLLPISSQLQDQVSPSLELVNNKVMDFSSQQQKMDYQFLNNSNYKEGKGNCQKKNACISLAVTSKSEGNFESDRSLCKVDELDKCNNNSENGQEVQIVDGSNIKESEQCQIPNSNESNRYNSAVVAQELQCNYTEINGIFSDLCDPNEEELFFKNNNDYSSWKHVEIDERDFFDELPKNFNLTENIRTYTKKSIKKLSVVNKDCVKLPSGDVKLDICKNVNSSNRTENLHSNVQNSSAKSKELKVILYRLSNAVVEENCMSDKEKTPSIKQKCDRGQTPPKNARRRKSIDKSENNNVVKAPHLVQNHNISPLQDVNPRVNPKVNFKSCCDLSNSNIMDNSKIPRVLLERIPTNKKSFARSVLANVPGLNDFQMMRPLNVNHIVNVVQVSGGRTTQTVPIQNTQTSTQVSPHIQRIGQPRISEQKPDNTHTTTYTSTQTTPVTATKTTSSQPSTLINILSQQIIRPVTTQSAPTLRRQPPFINILSQQIIRPSQTPKVSSNNTTVPTTADGNQVKPAVTSESRPVQVNNVAKSTAAGVKTTNTVTTGSGGTILQFICKSSLPKFQQAFGKTVYQNNTESTDVTTTATNTVDTTTATVTTAEVKKTIKKTVPVNVQPIQGSVIYSRQVPVGPTISLIPSGATTRQLFRIASTNSEQISLVKDSVIHSKMSALLAAALQGRPKNADGEVQVNCEEGTKVTLTRPTLVQNARLVKPVQLQLPTNVIRAPQPNLSSTTLEQLREFDMVYKQIKERSGSTTPAETSNAEVSQEVTQQRISVTYVNQLQKYTQLSPVVVVSSYSNLQPAASPALSVTSQGSSSPCVTPASTPTLPKIATKSSKVGATSTPLAGKTLKTMTNNTATKSSPIPKPQQKPQEDEHTTQRIFDILAEYAEQLRNSPDLNNKPAPRRRSNPPTNPSQNSKRKKSSSGSKKTNQTSSTLELDADDMTVGSEDSSGGGIVQLSVTDDEQSQAATVNTIEANDNSSSSGSRQLILTDGGSVGNQSRNLIIADSSVGEALKMPNTAVIVPGSYIMPVSMVKGGQQIAVVSGGSKILATVPARSGQNMLLFQSFSNQNRKGAISAVKYSTIQPLSGISSQSLAGVSAQPPVILPSNSVATAVALGQPLTLKKIGDDRENNEVLLTIAQPKGESKNAPDVSQPDSSTSISSDSNDTKLEENMQGGSNEKIFHTYQKSVITNSVIATSATSCSKSNEDDDNGSKTIINMNMVSTDNIKVETKTTERMHSVLVTACSSNGPMLSHTTPRYRKPSDTERTNNNDMPNKEEFLHNGEKTNNNEQKPFRSNIAYYTNKVKKVTTESHKIDSELQKQAAIERELRLQKSLSEECEDLGVDEPSTSDLFPEADLLFDSNHSPSFDQTSQDIIKRTPQTSEIKDDVKSAINLFSDDENSSSLRTDLFEYVEYQTVDTALDYQAVQLMNGNTTGTESGSSGCEDNTLLPKCTPMSEVTLNSPISPDIYPESSLNKYKFKYSNRKKGEKMKQTDFGGETVSSSEDTIGSNELGKSNCEDENYKVVHVAITKTDIVKDERKCELHCDEDLDSPSGRGARRSVRKLCSCCNGSQDGNISRKRPHTSRPHTPAAPHKKAFLKKR